MTMKKLLRFSVIAIILLFPVTVNAQVLISILLGDALNTDKIEFGIVGGLNHSSIYSIEESKPLNSLDLGFYFHILVKNNSYFSTGVLVKSSVGGSGMPVYSMNDPDFDAVFQGGTLTKKIPCFYVPILFHQRFNNRWYIEAGPQLGLLHQEVDIFEVSKLGGDLKFTLNVVDQYKRIDAGLLGGVGYKFKKEIKSMAVGINYYYGLVDISADPSRKIKNSALYVYMKIPIGVGKAKE
jgi:hypothetical protein